MFHRPVNLSAFRSADGIPLPNPPPLRWTVYQSCDMPNIYWRLVDQRMNFCDSLIAFGSYLSNLWFKSWPRICTLLLRNFICVVLYVFDLIEASDVFSCGIYWLFSSFSELQDHALTKHFARSSIQCDSGKPVLFLWQPVFELIFFVIFVKEIT